MLSSCDQRTLPDESHAIIWRYPPWTHESLLYCSLALWEEGCTLRWRQKAQALRLVGWHPIVLNRILLIVQWERRAVSIILSTLAFMKKFSRRTVERVKMCRRISGCQWISRGRGITQLRTFPDVFGGWQLMVETLNEEKSCEREKSSLRWM